jgi:hypothetical protein
MAAYISSYGACYFGETLASSEAQAKNYFYQQLYKKLFQKPWNIPEDVRKKIMAFSDINEQEKYTRKFPSRQYI